MVISCWVGRLVVVVALAGSGLAQLRQPPNPFPQPLQQSQPAPAQPAPATQPGQQPANLPTPQPPSGPPTVFGGLSLNNVSLTEVIDLLTRQLKISYILDPRVRGGVILNTYGEIKDIDTRSLLDTILRINGAAMVKQGDIYRIVPLTDVSHLPISPEIKTDSSSIEEDDQTMFNLIFLKYVTADELMNVLKNFLGEGATYGTYPPANLLLILDSRRSMRRTMDLVSMFDSDQLANQRVHVFEVKNGRPADLAKELDNIVKSISMSEKSTPIKFLPIDRINTIIAVAPNPGAFVEVAKWLEKLDTPVKVGAGSINSYVYRVRFGDAMSIACSIQALYGEMAGFGNQNSIMACMAMANGMGGMGGPAGMVGTGMGGGMGGGMYGGGMYGAGTPGAGMYPGAGVSYPSYQQQSYAPGPTTPFSNTAQPQAGTPGGTDLTGTYLGNAPVGSAPGRGPRVVANPLNNTLLIKASPQEYENILQLLKDLDVPPRQVLIEAKIYSVDISHAFSSSVSAALQKISGTVAHTFLGSFAGDTTNLTLGTLVGKSRELATAVTLQEDESRAKVLSAPSVIATDSIAATINVGTTVPTLSAQAVTGVQSGGSSLFANSISNTNTGITLSITARVTPSGIVTMLVNQQVSDPTPTTSSSIQSPSFATKSIQTQITVQDGDTIAIGGAIAETNSVALSGIPGLNRIPVLGALFGSRSYSKERTELIIFITPHVIYDTNQMADATDELKGRMKGLRKDIKE
jgi:general secretion pathway protein D